MKLVISTQISNDEPQDSIYMSWFLSERHTRTKVTFIKIQIIFIGQNILFHGFVQSCRAALRTSILYTFF